MCRTGDHAAPGRLLLVTDGYPLASVGADPRELEGRSWQVGICLSDERAGPVNLRLIAAVRRALAESVPSAGLVVLLVGRETAQRRWALALAAAGLKARVRVAVHVRASRVPLAPPLVDLFRLADLIVTESDFGARAVGRCRDDGGHRASAPIVTIAPPALRGVADVLAGRDAARRTRLGVDRDQLVIGTTADTTSTAVLAMQIFRVFSDGAYLACDRCGRITPSLSVPARGAAPAAACDACGSRTGRPGQARPEARLLLLGRDLRGPADQSLGSWTAKEARRLLGLEGRVFLEGDPAIPARPSCEAPVGDLALADVFLAPHPLADVDRALLAACALGLPTVATRFGAAAEQLAGISRLVHPAATLDTSDGHREAIMDVGAAVRELLELAGRPPSPCTEDARRQLASTFPSPSAVAGRWHDHLARLVRT